MMSRQSVRAVENCLCQSELYFQEITPCLLLFMEDLQLSILEFLNYTNFTNMILVRYCG